MVIKSRFNLIYCIFKSLHEKEIALLENHEKLKTDHERRLKSIQNEIDRCDEYKNKINDLDIDNRSNKKNKDHLNFFYT